jgi:hypothetical protein
MRTKETRVGGEESFLLLMYYIRQGGPTFSFSRPKHSFLVGLKGHQLASSITGNKLTNNFADLVASDLGPDVARGPPVGPR